ncbi:purine-nucleoside phosphorylase [Actinomyces sp. zg-332]|uniref:purine-nucleoside phosphorylase n=1 Tax=Actinomyces sp. zg-332 TaxID=2708340 RepID=UPI00141E1729|nr:purine-nucleoside phosphorylase [Actinomyces sp. zg-332]QPK93673.1 purine-nucleoside phosphorylase [Actinomyces sp. zg-332]
MKEAFQTYASTDLSYMMDGANQIAQRTGKKTHDLLLVLGSGLIQVTDNWGEPDCTFPISDLIGVKKPIADGHVDMVSSYTVKGKNVLVYHGRSHLYEGIDPSIITLPVRIACVTGIKAAILTNANGCLKDWELGDITLITDHINMTGFSPFTGPVFTDISQVWSKQFWDFARKHVQREGVYALLRGPEYQTMAETKMLVTLGADIVGMSTVLEAIALHQLEVPVLGLSVVSDLSFSEEMTTSEQVLEAGAKACTRIHNLVEEFVEEL